MRLAGGARLAHTAATLAICACAQPSKPSLTLHDVPSDGNCLFSSVALSAALVDGDASQARARAVRNAAARLRSDTMDLLCPTGTPDPELALGGLPVTLLIEPAAGENEAGYCRRLRQPGQWGSTTEILALTKLLGRPVTVHTEFGAPETYGADEARRGLAHPLRGQPLPSGDRVTKGRAVAYCIELPTVDPRPIPPSRRS